jgi:hypothetical protein
MSLDPGAFDGAEGTIPRKGPGSTPGAPPFERFSELPDVEKHGVIETMTRFGGSFVQGLAQLWLKGDCYNREALEGAFGYFDNYVLTFRGAQKQTNGDVARLSGIPHPFPDALKHPWAEDFTLPKQDGE